MESKQKPLWLEFKSTDGQQTKQIMFKTGDDLRQDQLTLQIMGICDDMWKSNGLDLCMNVYKCISSGDEVGMIEIVTNSATIAGITTLAVENTLAQSNSKSKFTIGNKKL